MNEPQLTESLHRVRDDILVGPPPILQVHTAAARRRRRMQVGVAAAAATVVAVVGATVVLHDGGHRSAPDPAVRLVDNPAPVAWWGDGWLHVAHAAVELPRPDHIQPVTDGVVVWTEGTPGGTAAPVLHVADDGTTTTIAQKTYGWMFASDTATGWVAWTDHPPDDPPVLVVYDTTSGEEVARREVAADGPRHEVLDEGPYPVAIEDGVVFYADWDGDYRWDVEGGAPARISHDASTYLVDREAGIDMLRSYDEHSGYQAPFAAREDGTTAPLPSWATALSPDGRYASGGDPFGGRPRIYDLTAEHGIPTGLEEVRPFLASAFGTDGTITYAFATPVTTEVERNGGITPPGGGRGRPYSLVTCEIATASCSTVAGDIGGDESVLLPE